MYNIYNCVQLVKNLQWYIEDWVSYIRTPYFDIHVAWEYLAIKEIF